MAAEEKSAEVVVAAKGDELGGLTPEMSAAATGVRERTREVGKLAGRVTKFRLNPSAKEFKPACRPKSSELNDNVVVATGSFSLWMSTGVLLAHAPRFLRRLDVGQEREMRNLSNRGWRPAEDEQISANAGGLHKPHYIHY